jgi:hypothetical protein
MAKSKDSRTERNPDRTQKRKPGAPLRKLRGRRIAAAGGIESVGDGLFNVPSESEASRNYSVEFHDDGTVTCNCEDAKKNRRGRMCKHGESVVVALAAMGVRWADAPPAAMLPPAVLNPEEAEEIEGMRLYEDARRNPIVYPKFPPGTLTFRARQKKAARIMSDRLPRMLHELLETAMVGRELRRGRPSMPLHEQAFCVLMRTFYNRPLADTCSYLRYWAGEGLIRWAPSVNSLCEYAHERQLDAIFDAIEDRIARAVRLLERGVVIDSSSLSTCWSQNYLDTGRGAKVYRSENRWVKPHVAAGPVTNVVSAVELTFNKKLPKNVNPEIEKLNVTADVNFFIPLIRKTIAHGWNPEFAAADKSYMADENYLIAMRELGVRAYVPFRRNIVPSADKSPEMLEMLEFYDWHPDEFDMVYNASRPKIEGVFSAAKRTTGPFLWSRELGRYIDPQTAPDAELLRIGISRRLEARAKFIIHSMRQLVLLECMHDERVHFPTNRPFQPLKNEETMLGYAREEMGEPDTGDDADLDDELVDDDDEVA